MALIRKVYKNWRQDELRRACGLYLVTDDEWLGGRTLHACVAEAIVGGVTFVLLRNKVAPSIDLIRRARDLAPVCRVANVPIVINDDIEAAKAAGIDGVHIGQEDISCAEARAELGPDAIVGVSVKTPEQAQAAQAAGASYVGVGPVFANRRNGGVGLVSLDVLKSIAEAVDIPVVAMGGINTSNVHDLAGSGIAGVAALSAIMASPDIETAAASLKAEVEAYLLNEPRVK